MINKAGHNEGHDRHERDEKTIAQKYEILKSKYAKLQKENDTLRLSKQQNNETVNAASDNGAKLTYLKRKLEDLEQVHKEGKAKHHAELSAVKSELDRSRKLTVEQSEQLARTKKQQEASEVRIQDFKKAASSDQAELRELKSKVKLLEQERDKLSGKQSDAASLRRALTAAESKGRGELQAKDKQLAENMKALAEERKKVSALQETVRSISTKAESDTRPSESRESELRRKVSEAEGRVKDADVRYATLEELCESKSSQSELDISRLRSLVGVVTEQYAELASSCVSKVEYERVRSQALGLSMCVLRLERKLGNSNDMVESLALLIRQLQLENKWLEEALQDAADNVHRLSSDSLAESKDNISVPELPMVHDSEEITFYKSLEEVHSSALKDLLDVSKAQAEKMLSCMRVMAHDLASAENLIEESEDEMTKIRQDGTRLTGMIEASKTENAKLAQQVSQQSNEVAVLKKTINDKEIEILEREKRSRLELSKRDGLLKTERETTSRLQTTIQKCKMAEDALRAEIEQLSGGIADADIYREAYESIAEEMRNIVARNALAEEEAERLGKFNAEILSHRNPVQRICYVEKIRRELAETKQRLLVSTRDAEVAIDERDAFKNELCLYKSVAVPFDGKPKSNLTRVRRIPLTTLNDNSNTKSPTAIDMRKYVPDGDMTIDELH